MNIGDTITDGNVVWKLRRIDKANDAISIDEQYIDDNDDLNDEKFMNSGFYYCSLNTRSRTLKNRPSDLDHAFLMIVSSRVVRTQIIFCINGIIYIRNNDYWNNTYHRSDWYKFNNAESVTV